MAGGAGNAVCHGVCDGEQLGHFLCVQRLFGREGLNIILQLVEAGHAGEHHRHAGNRLQKTEGPGGNRLVRAQSLQAGHGRAVKLCQTAAAKRLHDPDGEVVFLEQLHLGLRVLEMPVDIVQLDLTEFHFLSISLQEALHDVIASMGGEAQVADAAIPFLLPQIVHNAVLFVQIGVDIHLADVVEQVEIKIFHLAFFQLAREDFLYLRHVGQIIAREFAGQIKALPGMLFQSLTDDRLGMAVVVAPGRIVIVDALRHGVVHHVLCRFHINVRVRAAL